MSKNCKDPVCPANKYPVSTGKQRKSKTKKPRTKVPPSTSKARSKPRKKKSKCFISKKRSRDRVRRSKTPSYTICKNKKCQASKTTVECSTSTCSRQRICVRSKESVRSNKSRSFCHDSGKRTICHCSPPPRSSAKRKRESRSRCRLKKSKKRESDRKNKLLTSLCACVRGSSSRKSRNCKCPSSCAMLSKYDECCCQKSKRSRSKRKENRVPRNKKLHDKCLCTPPSASKSSPNIFTRGLASLRRRIQNFRFPFSSCENPKCTKPRECRHCPVRRCCSKTSMGKRDQNVSERRKVKFRK